MPPSFAARRPSVSGTQNPGREETFARQGAKESSSRTSAETLVTTQQQQGHVDVQEAEANFEALRRHLSGHSSVAPCEDLEKQVASSIHSDEFDLAAYLRAELDSADAAGCKRKALGVSWENFRVAGEGGEKVAIGTFLDACRDWCMYPINKTIQLSGFSKPTPKDLLVGFDGCLKPGEMCLVLGRPGSGCTTFLKTIANNRGGYLAVDGDVSYGSIPAAEMAKRYRGEVVYNPEDDIHAANLTVAQTLLFALRLKTPGKLLPGKTNKGLQAEVMDVLTKMLGISHTKSTKVGSAEVRGISGGERKRVSIAEMLATRATVCSWDNSTRGLDASSALDYAKSLRILTDVHQMATFVSLYQAGEGIYEQFDKVLLIDEGRQVYFGPACEAREYMMSLGYADLQRQTTADYLTGCTDANERKLAEGRTEADVPSTPQALEAAFKQSKNYVRMIEERDIFRAHALEDERHARDFREAVAADKGKGARQKSPYTASFPAQVWALMVRHVQLKSQDRVDLFAQYSTTLIIALTIGFAFFQLPTDSAGATTRGGGIFLAVIFLGFQAFNELPSQMTGRPIVWKHKTFALYRPSAVSLASVLADLPSHLLLNFLFHITVYMAMGLYPSPGAFFSYFVLATACYLAVSSVFRLIGSVCKNYDQCNRYAVLATTFFELLSGYLISLPDQHSYIRWLSYVNPMFYGFSSTMMNEYKRIDFTCDGTYIFPNSMDGQLPQYPTTLGDFQTCTIAGAQSGSNIIAGRDFLLARYGLRVEDQWRNFGIMIAMYIFFLSLQALCAEFMPDGNTAPRINVFAKEDKERQHLNAELEKNKQAYRRGEMEQDLSSLIQTKKPFTWKNLTYTVPVTGGQRQLLDHVFGFVRPGQLTALMGSSGAGKTTLLDVLANRKTVGVIGGDRLVAGRTPGKEFQRGTAYVEQQDVHESTQTVREALRFSAYLRQPAHVSKSEKDRYVEEVIQLLELEDKADAMIGDPGFGLDVEARKRVTIGVELASKPQLLLFLDEPTSGLDGQSAYNIVRFLRKLAAAGQAILVTIHQPNALLFENFDRLLLLKAGGRCCYFGDIGKDSHVLREYLARNGAHCPPTANPAEYMLEAIGAGSSRQVGKTDWADLWLESPEFEKVKQQITELDEEGLRMDESTDASLRNAYATPFFTQLAIGSTRALKSFWRSPDYGFTRLYNHISTAVCLAIIYPNLDNSVTGLQYKLYAQFYLVVIPALMMAQVQPMFYDQRTIFHREASSKMYSSPVFGLAQVIAEVPYSILCSIVFFLLFYYPIGFNTDSNRAGFAFIMIFLLEMFSITTGQAFAALMPTAYAAEMCNPCLLIIYSVFCGVTILPDQLARFWRSWLLWLNPFTWLVEAMMVNEMGGMVVECSASDLRTFTPPPGQTCLEWANDYISLAGGYLINDNDTSDCSYCQYATGDEYAKQYGWSFANRGRDLGIFLCYIIFNIIVTVLAARFLTHRYSKR
ncbi:pleiotropic drug resistance ABC transporter [Leucosporidium creatinivorum]|uniref:Pleiotropic drug resistance ABC transporter n=1 Tax=Leucosporidium creatinivorum TaxID=106004 RepID=A0A1Y2ENV7_9BASI|nr:pleiotropic drug resistance ABC transporter [Leucosporidium creatinivorum]